MKKRRSSRKRNLKKLIFILIIFILFFMFFTFYFITFNKEDSNYFDGVYTFIKNDTFYATAGCNNDNKNFYKKAKITKYLAKDEKNFEKIYSKGYRSNYMSIINDEDSLIAVGSYEKTLDDFKNKNSRALIVKYNKKGEIELENDFKLLDKSSFTKIIKVSDGFLVIGQSVSLKNKKTNGGAIIVKYDKNLNLLWSQIYGNNKQSIFYDAITLNDYIYVVGYLEDNIGVICKYDLNGNFIVSNDYKYTNKTGFRGIVNLDNSIFVSGSNKDKAMIVKYDLDCNYLQEKVYQSRGSSSFNKITKDNNDNLIVIGSNLVKNKKHYKGEIKNYDGIIGKYNNDLEEIAIVTYGDERKDYFTDIAVVDDNYLVVGYSEYEDGSYLSKFINYSNALKVLEVG